MRKHFLFFAIIAMLASACGDSASTSSNPEDMAASIAELEGKLMNDSTLSLDFQVAKELIPAYIKFAESNPDDPKSPDYIFKAAEICQGMGQGNLSVKYYQQFLDKYPDNKRAVIALFQKAFVYETVLANRDMAVKTYEEFLEKYPEHELAPSAQYSIKNIDKTPEELIEEFKAKEKTES